jgi:TP901-1 family phage major tail protein
LTLEAGEADASSRGSGGWRETIQALKDASIEFEMVSDNGDAAFIAIKDAYFNGTSVDVIALDGPEATAGNEGLRIIAAVSSFSRSEPLEDAVTISVTLKPTPNSDATPAWYTS